MMEGVGLWVEPVTLTISGGGTGLEWMGRLSLYEGSCKFMLLSIAW